MGPRVCDTVTAQMACEGPGIAKWAVHAVMSVKLGGNNQHALHIPCAVVAIENRDGFGSMLKWVSIMRDGAR